MNNENSNPFNILKDLKLEDEISKVPELVDEDIPELSTLDYSGLKIRVWLDKKKRKGKTVSLIKGLDSPYEEIKSIAKKLKTKLGVGGSVDSDQLLIQSQNRDEIIKILKSEGFRDVLKAGS